MILVLEPKPRHSSPSYINKLSTDSISLLSENRLSSGSSSSDHDSGKPEFAVRRIAGKKISALFEVGFCLFIILQVLKFKLFIIFQLIRTISPSQERLVEGLKSATHRTTTAYRDSTTYLSKEDSVDV